MKNKDVFQEKLEESTKIRSKINDELRAKKLNVLSRAFKRVFPTKSVKDFRWVKDAIHYRGLVRAKDNPYFDKQKEMLDNFISVIKFLDLMDDTTARDYLRLHGNITIEDKNPIENKKILKYKKDKELAQLIPELTVPIRALDQKEAAIKIFDLADQIQGEICQLSDQIKFTNASVVNEKCGIKKADFKKAVELDYKAYKKEDKVDKDVEQLDEDMKVASEGFDFVKKKNENKTGKKKIKTIKITRG